MEGRVGKLLPEGRILFLDAVRGLAALAVVAFHLGWISPLRAPLERIVPQPLMAMVELGHAGVTVFFALSGFVIARSLSNALVDARYFGRFALRRSLRLDPPYWCAVAIAAVLLTIAAALPGTPPAPTLAEVAAHVAYLQDILGMRALALQFWTLPYELQFYLVACALRGFEQVLTRALSGGGAVAALLVNAPLGVVSFVLAMGGVGTGGWFLECWYQFALGALTCRMLEGRVSRGIWAACMVVVAAGGAWTESSRVALLVATCAAIALAARAGRLTIWGAWRPLQWLGSISYSLYLTHFVGFLACVAIARLVAPGPAAALGFFSAAMAASVLLAFAFHRLVEAPSLALSRSPHPFRDLAARARRA